MNDQRQVVLQDSILIATKAIEELDYYRWELIKSFLHDLFCSRTRSENFRVMRFLASEDEKFCGFKPVSVSDQGDYDLRLVLDGSISATLWFQGGNYEVVIYCICSDFHGTQYFISVLGLEGRSNRPKLLVQTLIAEMMEWSPYRGKIITLESNSGEEKGFKSMKITEVEHTDLSDVFLKESVQRSLRTFVDCVKNYSTVGRALRYLLSGKPGTGKTKVVRAIANELCGSATFLLANPSSVKLEPLFSLARMFSPVVVCIDDVDIMVGNREDGRNQQALGRFLQYLDGFVESHVFVLATTNDKKLVDMAASRPGRFDMLIDIQELEPNFYGEFIRTKTTSPKVIELFDHNVLSLLEARKVTGAFLSNLIKQLEIQEKLGDDHLSSKAVVEDIIQLHQGFYKDPIISERIGFTS